MKRMCNSGAPTSGPAPPRLYPDLTQSTGVPGVTTDPALVQIIQSVINAITGAQTNSTGSPTDQSSVPPSAPPTDQSTGSPAADPSAPPDGPPCCPHGAPQGSPHYADCGAGAQARQPGWGGWGAGCGSDSASRPWWEGGRGGPAECREFAARFTRHVARTSRTTLQVVAGLMLVFLLPRSLLHTGLWLALCAGAGLPLPALLAGTALHSLLALLDPFLLSLTAAWALHKTLVRRLPLVDWRYWQARMAGRG